MLDATETQRLASLYEQLRLKLLDLSKKNRMLNFSLGARSKRHLQIVDEVLEEIYKKLVEEDGTLRINPLVEPDNIASRRALERAGLTLVDVVDSSAEIMAERTGIPAARNRTSANVRVAEVATVHRPAGRLFTRATAPGIATTPSMSSTPPSIAQSRPLHLNGWWTN